MSDTEYVLLLMSGLVGCYWAGFKFGTVVRIIKNLGNSA